jgi:tetratricopeptide (TPR) repeat protein
LIETMYRTKHYLRTLTLIVAALALCNISPATLAWRGDTVAPWVGNTLNGTPCKGLQVAFGPYDYLQRDKLQAELEVVEENHFTTEIEKLQEGQSTTPIGEIHYTLMVWPNHHRALQSALQFRLQNRGDWAINNASPAECVLQRAIKFSPNDPIPYMLHGLLMHRAKQYEKALTSYRAANRLRPNDIITQYNMGLTLVELKKYREAAQLAKKVYNVNFPLPGLKKKLIAAGHWNAETGTAEPKTAKLDLTPVQIDAIKKAMQDEATRKKAAPAKAAP